MTNRYQERLNRSAVLCSIHWTPINPGPLSAYRPTYRPCDVCGKVR